MSEHFIHQVVKARQRELTDQAQAAASSRRARKDRRAARRHHAG